MKSWNFLIQQEGDNTWLPLESQGSEILEGRYRIMARTECPNCIVDLHVSHLDLETLPPHHRVHRRQARTTPKGLVALLPFTLLKPGVWEIRCQAAPTPSSTSGESSAPSATIGPQKLQLQVLPQEAESDLDLADLYGTSVPEDSPSSQSSSQSPLESPSDFESSLANGTFLDSELDNGFSLTDRQPSLTVSESVSVNAEGVTQSASITSSDGLSTDHSIEDLEDYLVAEELANENVNQTDPLPAQAPVNQPLSSSAYTPGQATAGADEIEVLMQTADEMAAHIIETMNAEFDRLQTGGAQSSEVLDAASDSGERQSENKGPNETSDEAARTTGPDFANPQSKASPSVLPSELGKESREPPVEHPASAPQSVSIPEASSFPNAPSFSDASAPPNVLLNATPPTPSPQWTDEQLNALGCQIALARECYTVVNDQLILTGMIEGRGTAAAEIVGDLSTLPLAVRIQLIQPQTGDRILEHDASLVLPSLPSPFSVLMAIPKNIPTHILVGEISLCVAGPLNQPSESGKTQVLAQQSFTVTVDLNTLLDTVTLTPPPPSSSSTGTSTAANVTDDNALAEPCLPTSQSDLVKATQREFQTVGHNPLPPKLTSPKLTSPRAGDRPAVPVTQTLDPQSPSAESRPSPSLELPPFLQGDEESGPSPMAIAIAKAMQASMQLTDSAPSQSTASAPSPPEESPDVAPGEMGEQSGLIADNGTASPSPSEETDIGTVNPDLAPTKATASNDRAVAETISFESESIDNPFGLLLEDEDLEDEDLEDEVLAANSIAAPAESALPQVLLEPPTVEHSGPRSAVNEYVVDEAAMSAVAGDAALQTPSASPSGVIPTRDPSLTVSPALPNLPNHMPIPTPTLYVPEDELVAGFPIRIAVTLPQSGVASLDDSESMIAASPISNESARSLIFVKLWVQDRQTRSILDGPRWLVDFITNGSGELEAMTQLVLPIGCLEVSVEAIAVEMATQRESHKVTIHRTIMPTAAPSVLTTFNFDDLN